MGHHERTAEIAPGLRGRVSLCGSLHGGTEDTKDSMLRRSSAHSETEEVVAISFVGWGAPQRSRREAGPEKREDSGTTMASSVSSVPPCKEPHRLTRPRSHRVELDRLPPAHRLPLTAHPPR